MKVYASIQEESTGRVFTILSDGYQYSWLRATPGCNLYGPFDRMDDVLVSMAEVEGRTSQHWMDVFSFFYPDMPVTGYLAGALQV